MGYGASGIGGIGCGKGGFDGSIIIWIVVILLLLGDGGSCKDFGKGGNDSIIWIIVVLLLLFGGGTGFLGLGTETTE